MKKSIAILALLTGCAVGPNYQKPETTVSDAWQQYNNTVINSGETICLNWWKELQDPLLTEYIDRAAKYNHNVLAATAGLLRARAFRQIEASSFYPQIGADVNATKTYFSKNGPLFAIGESTGDSSDTTSSTTGLPFSLQTPQIQNLYNFLFDASWEIDIFGKTRRKVEAANAMIGSAYEYRNGIILSIVSELARNYVELRAAQAQKNILESMIAVWEQELVLKEEMLSVGYTDRLSVENAAANLANQRAMLPELCARIAKHTYAISTLTGSQPDALEAELSEVRSLPQLPDSVAIGIKSDLLRRRPDVRRAERNLAAATAGIGVAVAEFFPTITLLGDGGLQSLGLKNLFNLGSRTWALGGDVSIPLFRGGQLKGNLTASKAETVASAHIYQQTVLTAIEEGEGALAKYSEDLKMLPNKAKAKTNYRSIVELNSERNATGMVSLFDLLNSQHTYYQSELEYLVAHAETLLDLISLYKALGGGWESFTPPEK